jgi:hypothetical protein
MSRGKPLVADEPQQAPRKAQKAIESCSANGCPLPGTIANESGTRLCSGHYHASPEGWPRATAVLIKFAALWRIARDAAASGLPDSASKEKAATLFDKANRAGLKFSDQQRADYRRAGLKYAMAGALVERAINAAASDASLGYSAPKQPADDDTLDGEVSTLAERMRFAA